MDHPSGRHGKSRDVNVVHAATFGAARPRGLLGRLLSSNKTVTWNDMRALLDAAPFAGLLVDADDRIVVANAEIERLLCFGHGALDGTMLASVVPARRQGFVEGRTDEVVARRADGTELPIDIAFRRVALEGREAWLVVASDATERWRAQREAARQRDELAHLSRVAMLGELSGALAHELNQPLSAILSNAQAAQRLLRFDPPEMTEVEDILADIVADDRRAGDVIQRLRTWLRKEQVEHVPLGVNGVVLDALHLVRGDLQQRNVDVQLELAGEIPRVLGDRIQLQQVLLNLVMNGADAMDGATTTRTLCVRTTATAHGARVDVLDSGRGIAPEIRHTMFEPFETTKPNGMGMGLAVCRTIIEAHGGHVWAEDRSEGGTCVAFEIPEVAP
jgi:two-component system sensor kinase FixL